MSIDNTSPTECRQAFGRHSVLHCHHYNCFLQRTIQDPEYIETLSLLKKSAAEIAYEHFSALQQEVSTQDWASLLSLAANLCKYRGFGILDFSKVNDSGGRVTSEMSHYGVGWLKKFGESDSPICHFLTGYIQGVLTSIFQKEYSVSETLCYGKGNGKCIFEVYEDPKGVLRETLINERTASVGEVKPLPSLVRGNVNEEIITNAVTGLDLQGNEEGLIDTFGVYLTRMYGDYYNKISYGFEKKLEDICSVEGLAQPLLVEAGHVCGFNTFGGIMKSPEWYSLVVQDAKDKMDWVHGMVAVINALGWGKWTIKELIDGKKLVIHIYNSYEAQGYRKYFGKAKNPKCYMAQGTTSAIMNLVYLGEIDKKPDLTDAFYEKLFSSQEAFYSQETKCFAAGDGYCEFVVERL